MDRRNFIKTLGVAGASTIPGKKLLAGHKVIAPDGYGLLIDTTRCVGCQACSEACAEANGLPEPDLDAIDNATGLRKTTPTNYTVISELETSKDTYYVKSQCMHCNNPACATACPTQALYKTEEGAVIWREDKCMGCRFCMVSCPFEIPKFEYESNNPKIAKCTMCWERLKEGEQPACVNACDEDAIVFGKRKDLLEQAKTRIYQNPDDYYHSIYGENEVGGTSTMYLSAVPFEELGFRTDLGTTPYPEFTKNFLYSVPVVLTLWPAFLLALNASTKRDDTDI